ncbi:discoidin domain-containing protein [Phytohabitans suffuscus]|uniref:F5/8 type C domain-containing protein n=1 Tax=Phytohabitans suffuscus TaxID=624315 RepID=A0A6F8YK82_9ACTN|nr:discoidin domain-containing protein [Phytohabitans suffuscus]BCB86522.1 hypothetical protein Psuf_038350 [Phytohabitans suffuscus]
MDDQSPSWLTDTGRWRRIGSALHWVGDRVAVVGADPDGAVAAMAAEFAPEPDVVTVLGRLDMDDDGSLVEAVWPIAVPPGSRGRLAVGGAGAPESGMGARLASELTATVIAPRSDVLLAPGGSIFAVDGWMRYDASGSTTSAGRRTPAPEWESDVDAVLAHPPYGALVVLPVPAGLWIFPDLPGTPPPNLDDLAYSVPVHRTRPVLLIGRPGFPAPGEEAIVAVARALPPPLRRRLVLAPYGPVLGTAPAAARLAREDGHPVTVATGIPVLARDGELISLAMDQAVAGGWVPLATTLTFPPAGPARPSGPVRGLDGYTRVDEYVYQLDERWVAEVTQSGLWVRPRRRETGADVVRRHPWAPTGVRVFVGLPGHPPGPEVLPLLGALLARLPAATGMRVELTPEPFAAAASSPPAGGTPMDPYLRRAILLDASAAPAGRPVARSTPAPAATARPPAGTPGERTATLRRPAVVAAPVQDIAGGPGPEQAPPARLSGRHRFRVRRRWAPITAAAAVLAVATAAAYALGTVRTPAPTLAPQAAAPQASPAADPGWPPAVRAEATGPGQAGPSLTRGTGPASGSAGAAGVTKPAAPTTRTTAPRAQPATAKPIEASPEPPGLVNASGRNLAVDGTATASSEERPGALGAANVKDGDAATRWASDPGSDPQWLTLDLRAVWQVSQVQLRWQSSYATAYRVDVSADGVSWRTVYQTSQGSGGVDQVAVPRTPARFVRITGIARASARYGYSLWEVEVR